MPFLRLQSDHTNIVNKAIFKNEQFLSLVQYSVFICSDIAHVLIDLKSLMQVFSLLKIVTLPVWPIKLDFLMTCEFDVCMYHSGSHVACVVYLMNYPHY